MVPSPGVPKAGPCFESRRALMRPWVPPFPTISSPLDSAVPGRKELRLSLWLYAHRFARF